MSDPSLTSQFLSSPVVGGAVTAATSALGGPSNRTRVKFQGEMNAQNRKDWKKRLKHSNRINFPRQDSVIQRRVADAKAAGLHPLAALGISTGGSSGGSLGGSATASLPGQSRTGSAIGDGIQTAVAMQSAKDNRAHQALLGQLNVDEQMLRNQWLEEQIKHSRQKRLEQTTNSGGRGSLEAALAEQKRLQAGVESRIRTSKYSQINTGATSPAEDWETRYSELGGIAGGLVNAGYDTAHNLIEQSLVDKLVDSLHPPLTNYYDELRRRQKRDFGEHPLKYHGPKGRVYRHRRHAKPARRFYNENQISP